DECRLANLPAPIVTASSFVARTESGQAASNTITKPIKPAQLQAALAHAVSGARPAPRKVAADTKLDGKLAERLPFSVLLVDDNVINQKVASRLLQQMGYKADIASNGLEAIRALEGKAY